MGYRILRIKGVIFEYVIGHKFTKVRHGKRVFIFPNSTIGTPIVYLTDRGESEPQKFMVRPSNVRAAITNTPSPEFTCTYHNWKGRSMSESDYAAEIYGKTIFMMACPECHYEDGMAI